MGQFIMVNGKSGGQGGLTEKKYLSRPECGEGVFI